NPSQWMHRVSLTADRTLVPSRQSSATYTRGVPCGCGDKDAGSLVWAGRCCGLSYPSLLVAADCCPHYGRYRSGAADKMGVGYGVLGAKVRRGRGAGGWAEVGKCGLLGYDAGRAA